MERNVLIVDDSSTMRMLVRMALKVFTNFKVFEAKDGVEAIENCSNMNMDLIITDLNMPEMNGFDFIRYIRKNLHYQNTPIIVLTTEGRDEDKKQALNIGANDYIIKPFQPVQLQEKIKNVFSL